MEIALIVLLVLSFPIIAIAGLVIAIGARDRVRALEQRFADFQRARPISAAPAAVSPQPGPLKVLRLVLPVFKPWLLPLLIPLERDL